MARTKDILFTSAQLKALLPCRMQGREDFSVGSVAIDSRKVRPGCLFVPLEGERTNGHNYISSAIAGGARAILIAEKEWGKRRNVLEQVRDDKDVVYLLVPDPLTAMQQLAAGYLEGLGDICRIGVTGSNGKTTSKEIIGSILIRHAETYINAGNLNSEIGLPLSVFEIRRKHKFAVLEMGMNFAGEMDILAEILRPEAALITNIGTAHIGHLGSVDAIAAEKKKIFKYFDGNQKGFLPEEEKYLPFLSRDVQGDIVCYGQRTTYGFQGYRSLGLDGTIIYWEGLQIFFPLIGYHNLQNALGAITLCRALGLEPEEIKSGLEAVKPLFGRCQIVKGPWTIIQDCYNANPESMQTSLGFFAHLPWAGRKIAVLGSMRELGEQSDAAHNELGRLAGALDLDAVFFFGEETAGALAGAAAVKPEGFFRQTADFDELLKALKNYLRDGDLLLLKGSRGVELERLVSGLKS